MARTFKTKNGTPPKDPGFPAFGSGFFVPIISKIAVNFWLGNALECLENRTRPPPKK